ncbi:MAG: RING-HC finger protein [Nitrosomonas sp.]|nr:RING-HC finger protein [Nitrosomonas sp.]
MDKMDAVFESFFGAKNKKNKKKKKGKKRSVPEEQYVEGPIPDELKHDVLVPDSDVAADADTACCICMIRKKQCIALPCADLKYCVECARQLCFGLDGTELKKRGSVKCPTCRQDIFEMKRVHD